MFRVTANARTNGMGYTVDGADSELFSLRMSPEQVGVSDVDEFAAAKLHLYRTCRLADVFELNTTFERVARTAQEALKVLGIEQPYEQLIQFMLDRDFLIKKERLQHELSELKKEKEAGKKDLDWRIDQVKEKLTFYTRKGSMRGWNRFIAIQFVYLGKLVRVTQGTTGVKYCLVSKESGRVEKTYRSIEGLRADLKRQKSK